MQTQAQCFEKIQEIADHIGHLIKDEAARLMHTGGIDLDEYEDNYLAPQILIVVSLLNLAEKYIPANRKEIGAEILNLRCF